MESVKRKGRLARVLPKILRLRAGAGISPDDDIQKVKSDEKMKGDGLIKNNIVKLVDEGLVREAFMAKMFASLSSIKASYAQLQYAQSPYDADGIQHADQTIVSELKKLSDLKQCYLKKELHEPSPETTLLMSVAQEQSSLLKTYEITSKKMDSQIRLKESEIVFLKEKLAETNSDCGLLESRLNSSGNLDSDTSMELSCLRPSHFIAFLRQAVNSIRSFVRFLVDEMNSQEWDLVAAAASIHPGVSFREANHACFAFESFVCRAMFDNIDHHGDPCSSEREDRRRVFYDRFTELESVRAAEYLARKPESEFAAFCRAKYLRVVHPKMEESFFGNLEKRDPVSSVETPFVEAARRVWLLRCLALCLDPVVSVFGVREGSRFSEVYMESVGDEVPETETEAPVVAFTAVPGFIVGGIVVQAQVYLNSS